ncbi:MAG TPA: o-succinylbenzoate--CoA ligase [Candidatus Sulfomarinibacteraceae bacterium]|nr:o-succinylbenzoate--CoA ligase [Candidatus Sulfomarinibacteraceae bacterium]
MLDWLSARAQTTPEAPALIIGERQWTYAALQREVEQTARGLVGLGVGRGDHVGVLLPNDLSYVCLVHALARLGAVLAPLNTRLAPAELDWQVRKTGCRLLLYGERTAQQAGALSGEGYEVQPVAALARAAPKATLPAHNFDLHAMQAVVFTSGTTGRPKGVMLTFANHFWSATASAFRLGLQPGDRWLSCLPLYHVGGLAVLFRSALYGTAVILEQGFDVARFNHILDEQAATMTSLVPTMLYRLLPTRRSWPASLRLVLVGGAATSPELAAASAEVGAPVASTYGLTEAASQVATMLPVDVQRKPGSVGRPLMFTQVQVVDETGTLLPPGERGEVLVKGPTVMGGYYEDEAATAQALDGGWLHTGDMGYVDGDGDLWIVQRRSDMIVSGGENVYPAEVERALMQHPAVAAACVVALPHAEWGQQVAAMVAARSGEALSEAALEAFLRERLAGYKVPRRWRFVAQLPQTASGKIARRDVQAQLQLERGRSDAEDEVHAGAEEGVQ